VSTFDDETPLEFFEEPETLESPERQRRRIRPQRRSGGPRRPAPPPPGAVALARLAGFVALAIAVVLVLVLWIGSCQGKSKHDEYSSYMDQIQPIAQSSAATGTAAFVKEATAPRQTLAGLQAKLEAWSQEQQHDYDEAVRLVPPAPLQAAHQEVLATLQLRAIGLTGLADVLGQAGSKPETVVADLLAKQAQLLSASDLVWAELFRLPATQAMKRAGIVGVIAPPSQLVSTPEVFSSTAFQTVYHNLHATTSTGKVKGRRGSELVSTEAVAGGSATPLTTTSPTTVNVSASLAFKVTFKNGGNFVETNVPVTLTVSVFNKQVLQRPLKRIVRSVQPQKTATVSFSNLSLPTTVFGAQATVNVKVGKVPGEHILDNNKASYLVFFSLPAGG
jgi:hypothetical protein